MWSKIHYQGISWLIVLSCVEFHNMFAIFENISNHLVVTISWRVSVASVRTHETHATWTPVDTSSPVNTDQWCGPHIITMCFTTVPLPVTLSCQLFSEIELALEHDYNQNIEILSKIFTLHLRNCLINANKLTMWQQHICLQWLCEKVKSWQNLQ